MASVRARAVPVLIDADNAQVELERVRLGGAQFNEDWLQQLIHRHPTILPISDIEPGFGDLTAVAREVPCAHGFIDNLYLTPKGEIVIVETKLWRNSQMRREVVAQALDYVAALTAMSFDDFERAITKSLGAPRKLFDLFTNDPEAWEEAQFVDAVAKNLRRGRMVVIVLGDGIRAETEALSELLQSHAGAHFTFALVELATWRNITTGELLAVPSTLAKTVMIERGIVRVDQPGVRIDPIPAAAKVRAQTISTGDFWEVIATRSPGLPAAIQLLLDAVEPLGVYPEFLASLNLKVDLPDRPKPLNLGYIAKNGQFWVNQAALELPDHIWKPYFEQIAQLVGGKVVDEPKNKGIAVNGKAAPRIEQLLPHHQDALVAAITTVIREVNREA